MTDNEWNMVINFLSDEHQQYSKTGISRGEQFWSWCQLMNDPVQSTAYSYFVQAADAYLATNEFLCDMGLDDPAC